MITEDDENTKPLLYSILQVSGMLKEEISRIQYWSKRFTDFLDVAVVNKIEQYSLLDVNKLKSIQKSIREDNLTVQEVEDYYKINGFKDIVEDKRIPEKEFRKSVSNDIPVVAVDSSISRDMFELLKEQLQESNKMVANLNERLKHEQELHNNTQLLFKKQQDQPKQDILLLEEHFNDLDTKLQGVKEKMLERKEVNENKGFWNKLFHK